LSAQIDIMLVVNVLSTQMAVWPKSVERYNPKPVCVGPIKYISPTFGPLVILESGNATIENKIKKISNSTLLK